ncbi:MAG TPA: hypothetical protein VFZ40_06525 [Pyrinomonadaceae bacterium]
MNSISSLVLFVGLLLAACSRPQTPQPSVAVIDHPTPTTSPASIPTPGPSPIPNPEMSLANGLKIVPKTITLKNERRRYEINVTFPQIAGTKDPVFLNLNHRIRNLVANQYSWPLAPPTKDDLRYYQKWPGVYNSVDLDYYVVLATNRFLSMYFEVYSYGIGAAHSVQESFTINFDMTSKTLLTLDSLFKPGTKPLQFISKYCIDKLSKDHSWAMNDPVFRDEVAPVPKNFASWNIVPEGIRINFDACKIDGCSAGATEVVIYFIELKPLMRAQFAGGV